MLFINNSEVAKVLTMKDTLEMTEEGLIDIQRGDAFGRPRSENYAETTNPEVCFRWKAIEGSSKRIKRFAIRLMSEMVSWPTKAGKMVEDKYCMRPGFFFGNIFLFDTENGEPLAIINDGYLQHYLVGARAGLGAKYLARQDASVVGLLGSGGQAHSHLLAFSEVRKIKKVKIFSPNRERREAFARQMHEETGIEIAPCSTAEDAAKNVDILASCTNAREPVVYGSMVEPGMHLTLVSGEAAEFSSDVYSKIDVCVAGGPECQVVGTAMDDTKTYTYLAGDIKTKVLAQKLKSRRDHFRGRLVTLHDLIDGKVQGRSNNSEVTSSAGLKAPGWSSINGLQYTAMASIVYDLVRNAGLGREVPTEWFLSDIRT